MAAEQQPEENHHGFFSFFHLGASKSSPAAADDDRPPAIDPRTPAHYPREPIADMRAVLHGSEDWTPLLEPLHPALRCEILKYGDFTQATYDSFDNNAWSPYCGSCLYGLPSFFTKLDLVGHHYVATAYIYAMCHVNLPRWLERALHADKWDNDSNWMGYVAVADSDEAARIGYRDLLVCWRGTIANEEWLKDWETRLVPLLDHTGDGDADDHHTPDGVPMVEMGFKSIFTSKKSDAVYNKTSAKEQTMQELHRLVSHFQSAGEELCITVCGHSLGATLATLTAYEAAVAFPGVPVKLITFGGPRTGNAAFCSLLGRHGVKALRMVVQDDLVPKTPGIIFDVEKGLAKLGFKKPLEYLYAHYGPEIILDVAASPFLKTKFNVLGFHNLEMYLHLVDGYESKDGGHRRDARRDPTLVNKSSGMLLEETMIPEAWYQPRNKGLVRNRYGRWVIPAREPSDKPVVGATLPLSDIP